MILEMFAWSEQKYNKTQLKMLLVLNYIHIMIPDVYYIATIYVVML